MILWSAFLAVSLSACKAEDPIAPDTSILDTSALIERLRSHGASVEAAGPISQPFLAVDGQILRVNGGDVQAFEYASAAEALAEASRVSPDGFTIGSTIVTWLAPPHFFREEQVLVIYIGDDLAVLEALQAVMGAQFAGR